ncbi:probable serine/threonine-protein kinase At1g54610 isoform X1 [Typha angustifolia]|uniref:probable serine/threonine-protein kinase At1g54610 isoform X1 n=1 Tax=Typha angustifolia TaxID=59011 RepID=UPI003C2C9D01
MGCAQAKPSFHSPPGGLEKLKLEHGYVPGESVREKEKERFHKEEEEEEEEREGSEKKNMPLPPRDVDELVDGWPRWLLANVSRKALVGLVPKSADSYDKLDKVGQGTYSNVYKARDRDTGKIVALKKVRFNTSEPESVEFMAREIMILQKLDHPNVIKLEGLATSRMHYSIYLVFNFMQSDLARVISRPDERLTEPQVKCFMQQLLSGLQHCHERGILHRDIKGSNLLIDNYGVLKIADFGLANFFNLEQKRPLTSRVVTLWYRAPELLLGTTDYGVGIDLWSAGCLLAEMFAGRPILPGRTEIEQLHKIFKLCGSPPEDYWWKLKLSASFQPPQPYKPTLLETFEHFPSSSLGLLTMLLALEPPSRGTADSALQNEFFTTSPLACDLSSLPVICKEANDECTRPRDGRKRKSYKLKQRSHKQREGEKENEQAMARRNADYGSSKEKAPDLSRQSQELDIGTASSTSSSSKLKISAESPRESPSRGSYLPNEQSGRTEAHFSASKNIKNFLPLPILEVDAGGTGEHMKSIHRYGLEKRSVSTSEFRRSEGNDLSKKDVFV